ncbi:hypothetical protein K458DRAFT_407471 [Lentithecium fluviatile CBS 122367]|uniref:Thioesterase/thiol ester dehydrase-isomerase n=1 Tax=Lentithecium fluviatile CBS 122367 TaxID=1168545 RepID=A0A6G1IPS1_9PLEO|nr:hypothetical protein K458DRAFT_407471 [Lentithecium fluviatile CBS 122367]
MYRGFPIAAVCETKDPRKHRCRAPARQYLPPWGSSSLRQDPPPRGRRSTLPMVLCTRCVGRVARAPIRRTQWQRIQRRYYSSTEAEEDIQNLLTTYDGDNDANWFQKAREMLLKRELPRQTRRLDSEREYQLYVALRDFLPREYVGVFAIKTPPHEKTPSVGNHLIFFNAMTTTGKLRPDGTDALHSPGHAFNRRMWTGGNLRVNRATYFDPEVGYRRDAECVCIERIKDVHLRGEGDTAKIFVTIERRFARAETLRDSIGDPSVGIRGSSALLRKQADMDGWGDAFMMDERTLVFMRDRSVAELDDIQAGKTTPTRYLDPPGTPDFSHKLTPTSALLFRFSALTFNAHAIHLDRDYTRNVEGHRNLLVHGPLTLMLMLRLVSGHLALQPGDPQAVQSIEYRNLAPLYCDEEMRICAREKTSLRTEDGGIYDVWIEGPSGGMAVKGTLRTTRVPQQTISKNTWAIKAPKGTSKDNRTVASPTPRIHKVKTRTLKESSPSKPFKVTPFTLPGEDKPRTSGPAPEKPAPKNSTHEPFIPAPTPGLLPLAGIITGRRTSTTHNRSRVLHWTPARLYSTSSALHSRVSSINTSSRPYHPYSTTTQTTKDPKQDPKDTRQPNDSSSSSSTPNFKISRVVAPPQSMRPSMSPISHRIADTIWRRNERDKKYDPVPIIRSYGASEWPTTFERKGVRLIVPNQPRIRAVMPPAKRWQKWEKGVWKSRKGGMAYQDDLKKAMYRNAVDGPN